ncbi:MAG TPA: hypothetical protein VHC67_10260 [Gaiellaceae bacterium]|nr:hypothetical protein [Gaiellaceae bacterium]
MAPFDWRRRAVEYDAFVYDWSQPGRFPTIAWDRTHHNMSGDTFKLPSYYGDRRLEADGLQEGVGQIASVVGATLVGIDKSDQDGIDYVDLLRTFFVPALGIAQNQPGSPPALTGESYWYTATVNVLYFMLGALYPDATDMTSMLRSIADRFYEQVVALGGSDASFDGQGFDFSTMTKNPGTRNEGGEGAVGTAAIELWAHHLFGDAKYLDAATWSMDYLERSESNLFYEILPQLAPYLAARMNAQLGTGYDVGRYFDWLSGGSAVRPGWGTIEERWGSYDTRGLIGSRTDGGGYAFAMNTFSAPLFAATAKYDPRFADTVGRWMASVHEAGRFFYADQMPAGNQWHGATYIDDPAHVIPYEGLRATENGRTPNATGDPGTYGKQWGLDTEVTTDLGLYGGSWVGFLGGSVCPTNVPGVLCTDLNALDFHGPPSPPTYLYYDPSSGSTISRNRVDACSS